MSDEPIPGWATQVEYRELAERYETLEAKNKWLREAIRCVLGLRSSYDADMGRDVSLVNNLQAREVLEAALRRAQ